MLEHSFEQDLSSGIQTMGRDGLDGLMDVLVDISSYLQATERDMEDLRADRATTRTQSTSTSQQGGHTVRGWQRVWVQPQLPLQEDLP